MANTQTIIVYDGKAPFDAAMNLCRHLLSLGVHPIVMEAEDYEEGLPGSIIVIGHHDLSKAWLARLGAKYNSYGMAYGFSGNHCVLTASRSALGRGKKGRKHFAEYYDARISTHYELARKLEIPLSFGQRDKTRQSQYDLLLLEFIKNGLPEFLGADHRAMENQEDIAKEAVAGLVKQMEASKDTVITMEDVLRNNYKQHEQEGIKTLRRHLGEDIVFTALWRDAQKERELDEDELLEGELSAFTFRMGCYLIRSAQRLYKDTDDIHYTERIPAEQDVVAEYQKNNTEMNSLLGRYENGVRKVQEISVQYAKSREDFPSDEWKFICLATTASSWAWYESIDFFGTVKSHPTAPDEQAELFVLNTYTGDSYGVDRWYQVSPDGTITEHEEHPYNPDSFDAPWKKHG